MKVNALNGYKASGGVGVTEGVIEIVGVILGVTDGVTETVALGVTLILGVCDIDILGVTLIEGVTLTLIELVTEGVTESEILGVGVGLVGTFISALM